MMEQEIKDRLAELYKAQEAAAGWGAAVGARNEEIKSLERSLRGLQRPSSGTNELRQLADEYEAGLQKMVASGYEEFGPDVQRKHRMVIDALRYQAGGVAQAAPEPLDYGDELLRWSNIEVALRKKFPTLNATGIEIDNWPALIDALAMSSTHQSSPAATTGNIPSGPRPPASAAMGHSAGDDARCEVCDWPLAESRAKGCVPGDCSYRPDDPAEQERIRRRRAQISSTEGK